MSFWSSDLGDISGNPEDAFAKAFGIIPDNTMALSRIMDFKKDEFNGQFTYKIDWLLIEGAYKGQHVFQKIKAFDLDSKKRHTALNMLVLIYKLFNVAKPLEAPNNDDLTIFIGKTGGIKIRETEPNEQGKIYNFVAEVHSSSGFISQTGERKPIVAQKVVVNDHLDSAFRRNNGQIITNDDIPF